MNRTQLLLIKLAEECTEVGKLALKAAQFGLDNGPDQNFTNAELLRGELDDVATVVVMLNTEVGLKYEPNVKSLLAKQAKIEKYVAYSQELGLVRS